MSDSTPDSSFKNTTTRFLNVDLDIEGEDLNELVTTLESRAIVLHHTNTTASFELLAQPPDPDTAIRNLFAVIDALPPETRALWEKCTLRRFSIGISAGHQPNSRTWVLALDTLKLVTQLRAEIDVTIYAPAPAFDALP
ncbi:hypothetical protein [Myxococcus stipitatus]|uniref:hypothetical protein n=1 Tax=Myxococcus stipitatus TaxID=83455 RepID=UPI0030D1811A